MFICCTAQESDNTGIPWLPNMHDLHTWSSAEVLGQTGFCLLAILVAVCQTLGRICILLISNRGMTSFLVFAGHEEFFGNYLHKSFHIFLLSDLSSSD